MNINDVFRDYVSELSNGQILLLIDEAEREIKRRDQKYRDQQRKRDAWYARSESANSSQGTA